MQPLTPTIKNLLGLNFLMFLLALVLNEANINLSDWLGLHHWESPKFFPTQFFTHIFMHANLFHLFSNMLSLYLFGIFLEQYWGAKKFMIYYLVTGVGAGFLHMGTHAYELYSMKTLCMVFQENPSPDAFMAYLSEYAPHIFSSEEFNQFISSYDKSPNDPAIIASATELTENIYFQYRDMGTVGASGSVFGILMACAMLYPNMELRMFFVPMPIKMKYYVFFYGGLEVYQLIKNNPNDNVAHFAHLGGLLIGFILLKIWKEKPLM